jgi:hypothetical protein
LSVQQELSVIRTASRTQANLDVIKASNDGAIAVGRQALIQELQDLFVWYTTACSGRTPVVACPRH